VQGFGNGAATGVEGIAKGAAAGVAGYCQNGEGVYARSGQTDSTTAGTSRNGVHGVTDSPTASGVWGEALAGGAGVTGSTKSATAGGVTGMNSGTGPGVLAQNSGGGTALQVTGPSVFNRSGLMSIAYPAKSAAVVVPGGLTASALVLATMQNAVSGVWVTSVIPNTATGQAVINLNKAPGSATSPKTAKVAWLVVN
jgi:hypothetical protein